MTLTEKPLTAQTGPDKIFDSERLTKIKNNFNGYRFCPRCSAELERRNLDGRQRLVCQSDGCDFIYYHNPVPAAGVVIYGPEGLLLVQRAHPPCVGWWCLPAGYMEWDESPEKTAVRETREETGLAVELNGLFGVYSGDDDPRVNAVLALYSARIIGGKLQAGDDASDAGCFALDALPEKVAFAAHRQAIADLKKKLAFGAFPP